MNVRTLAEPDSRVGVDPAGDQQHVYGDDDLLDALGLEDVEVHQPGVFDRLLWLPVAEDAIYRVTDENLEVMHHPEARRRDLRVPVIQLQRPLVIAVACDEEGLKAGR